MCPVTIAKGFRKRILSKHFQKTKLVSKFNSSILLSVNNNLITILAPARPLIPFSIRLNNQNQYNQIVRNINSIRISKFCLENNFLSINLKESIEVNLQLKLSNKVNRNHLEIIKNILIDSPHLWQISRDEFTFFQHLFHWVSNQDISKVNNIFDLTVFNHFEDIFSSNENMENFVTSLLGWGVGTTPAGDDFLLGCLLALHYIALEEPRKYNLFRKIMINSLKKNLTGLISKEFFKYGLKKEFSESINKFCFQLFNTAKIPCEVLSDLFYGASSGVDFLWGFIWTLEQYFLKLLIKPEYSRNR